MIPLIDPNLNSRAVFAMPVRHSLRLAYRQPDELVSGPTPVHNHTPDPHPTASGGGRTTCS